MNHIHDFFVIGVHGLLGVELEIGKAFLRLVVEFLFYGKGDVDLVLLIELIVAHKPVHPGPQHKGLAYGAADHMEKGILILCQALVFLFQVGFQGAKIQIEADIRLVVGAVGHNHRHDSVH